MSGPIRPPTQKAIAICPACGEPATSVSQETAVLEQYADGWVGEPGDPRHLCQQPARRMVPGQVTTRYWPCGHELPFDVHVHGPGCDPATGVCAT